LPPIAGWHAVETLDQQHLFVHRAGEGDGRYLDPHQSANPHDNEFCLD